MPVLFHRRRRAVAALVLGAGVNSTVAVVVSQVPGFAGLDTVVAPRARDDALLDVRGPLFPDRLVFGAVSGGCGGLCAAHKW